MLDRPVNAAGDVELRRDHLSGQTDLTRMRLIARVARRSRRADPTVQHSRQLMDDLGMSGVGSPLLAFASAAAQEIYTVDESITADEAGSEDATGW